MTMQSPARPPATVSDRRKPQQSDRSRADRAVRRRDADADAGMAGPAGADAGDADRPDGAADPGACSDKQPGRTDGGRS